MSAKRPEGVPENAVQLDDGTWFLGKLVKGKRDGQVRLYDATGFEFLIGAFAAGSMTSGYRYHPSGSGEINLVKKTGHVTRYDGETQADLGEGFPRFPSAATSKIVFDIDVVDAAKVLYTIKNPRYFDNRGNELASGGASQPKPTPTSILVESKSERFWQDGTPEKGVVTLHHLAGPKAFELTYAKKKLTRLSAFDEKGSLVMEQVYLPKPKLTLVSGKKRHAIDPTSAGAEASLATAKAFVARFKKVFGPLLGHAQVKVTAGDALSIKHLELETYADVIRVSSLLGNGGGDALIVIEEPGKHLGKVFWNLHDEGLESVESLGDYVEEEGLDASKKDRLITSLPFFQNPVAKSLDDLWKKLEVHPKTDYRKLIAALTPVK